MMMDQQRVSHGRRIMRRKRKRIMQGAKDVWACVRFSYRNIGIKCFKLKIPGILIQKLEASCCSSQSKRPTTRSTSSSSPKSGSPPHCHPRGKEPYPSTHSQELAKCIDEVVSQRYVQCKVDPEFNGPFTIPFPLFPLDFSVFADFASIGSVLYSLGGCPDHFDPLARKQVALEFSGCHPTKLGYGLPKAFVTGPPISGGKHPADPPPSRPSNNLCYHTTYCDFSKPKPQWEISSKALISPRLIPKLVSLKGKLYAFGGNCPTDPDAPFAEVFDPTVGVGGSWQPLPNPPFGRLASLELYVFPLPTSGRILVLGILSGIQYTFDVSTWYWHPFETVYPSKNSQILYARFHMMRVFAKPVLSVFDEALYWINQPGRLCVYNVGDGQYYEGYITGLHLDHDGRLLRDTFQGLALLPLSEHLIGLLWLSEEFNDVNQICSRVLHLTILHVSFLPNTDTDNAAAAAAADDDDDDGPKFNLTASAVACLSFLFEGDCISKVADAYLI